MSQAIMKEHKQASPAVTRGALKRKNVQQNCPSSKRTKMVSTKFMLRQHFKNPLHKAAYSGHLMVCKGFTPIRYAAQEGHLDIGVS